jgi:hypothetical protein
VAILATLQPETTRHIVLSCVGPNSWNGVQWHAVYTEFHLSQLVSVGAFVVENLEGKLVNRVLENLQNTKEQTRTPQNC